MSGRLKKIILVVLAAALVTGAGFLQKSLNHDRDTLGLTHVEGLTNAPPVLAFTTVALGGFRGLISNLLWTRANQLQEDDKFFEMAQLSDWITKLEPHFSQVWVHEAWNMAYNISVKFKDFPDRWRWVQNGIELLRDQGLRYNPDDLLIHRELAWFFQHKMGANLDDASMYYKTQWKKEMEDVFGGQKPDFETLIHPRSGDEINRAQMLREKYKMDPVFMQKVDEEYGPLEWRLPEASAIYWAAQGLERAKENPSKISPTDDLIVLRRVIYQCMQLTWQRGRIVDNPFNDEMEFGPNLDVIPKVNDTYLTMYDEEKDPNQKEGILKAHRNFLRQAIYSLYVYNRTADAAKWFKYLGQKYPDKTIIDGDFNSYPRNVTLDQYAVACVQADINDMSPDRVRTVLEGLLITSYTSLVIDQDERAEGLRRLAQKAWDSYESKLPTARRDPLRVPPIREISRDVLNRLLNPTNGLPSEAQAVLRTKLNLPATGTAPVGGTNQVEMETRGTNAP
ncbi:MAG TPA: hypothetical protein VG938_12850 [Verrucomicrobiae bacterium]|jgi:hypothetical protein|nr:hypothetical protein [Verrucomicrobiae bacterium]